MTVIAELFRQQSLLNMSKGRVYEDLTHKNRNIKPFKIKK